MLALDYSKHRVTDVARRMRKVPRVESRYPRLMSRWPTALPIILVALITTACGEEAPTTVPATPAVATDTAAEAEVETAEAETAEVEPETEALPPIAIDTHVDTTQRMLDSEDDIAERLEGGHLDIPRMREGGLTGAFFSIWVHPRRYPGEAAWERTQALIGAVEQVAEAHPELATICRTVEDVRRAHAESKIALLMGVEGGHALGEPEDEEEYFRRMREIHRRGVRYMTVTWSNDNAFAHSSGGEHAELGLTDLGRRMIREMNRLGVIVDVSHVSDQTFWDIVEVAERPLLASHSSCRALADHPRNMTDRMIRAVHDGGGAVCINYYTQFIDTEYAGRRRALEREHRAEFSDVRNGHDHSWMRWGPTNELAHTLAPEIEVPTLSTLGAHFTHVAELTSPDAVCLGSDFDGVGELPAGLEDVSDLGALREELERRELPVPAIFGENVLRVLSAQDPDWDRVARPRTPHAASVDVATVP